MSAKKLPIGIENFEKLRREDFYYIDKTGLIKDLLNDWGEVNLFTRPRRFGKSLNMSMLKCFFELGGDPALFEGLKISQEKELCEKYRGKFPVISLSLKGIQADNYEKACKMAAQIINGEARRHQYLLDSEKLTKYDKEAFLALLRKNMEESILSNSLKILSDLLKKHYDKSVILLIDEYDVPLAKAFSQGYYEEMVNLIRNLFGQALKTNDSLYFAVLTGCMRISKESIFTGLNNMKVLSIADVAFDEYFGFMDHEVKKLLDDFQLSFSFETVKEWYDGYRFGNAEVYCPWDVICYCNKLRQDAKAEPENYWSNTSSNDIVRRFIKEAGQKSSTKREIERLVAGEIIEKEIHPELTYKDMYRSIEHIWSVLYTTGYLTQQGRPNGNRFCLAIPNMEIRAVFTSQIMEYFKETVSQNGKACQIFCDALKEGDAHAAEIQLNEYLRKTISIRDTFVRKKLKENFYHGILLGLLGFQDSWVVSSNRESGEGYGDILVEIEEEGIGIILEIKYPADGNLEAGCQEALRQIEEKNYEESLRWHGIENIRKYGVACFLKKCRIIPAIK